MCDHPKCGWPAEWTYVGVTVRRPGEDWRPYQLCPVHAKLMRKILRAPVKP